MSRRSVTSRTATIGGARPPGLLCRWLNGWRLSALVFLLLFALTNLGVARVSTPFDARFRFPRATVRGWQQAIEDARLKRAEGHPIVVVLGDSVGWGYASRLPYQTVPYGIWRGLSSVPADRLPPFLRKREPEVYNLCAMAAYAPDQYALLVRCLGTADLIVLQLYPGHYSEPYLKEIGFPSFSELAAGLDPSDPLSRELIEAAPAEGYPQRLLGWTEAGAERMMAWLPLARKRSYFLSCYGSALTDPTTLLRSLTRSSPFRPYPALPPKQKQLIDQEASAQMAFTDGPLTRRALRFFDGILAKAQERAVPIAVAVTPWNPLARRRLVHYRPYLARVAQLRAMTERHGGLWLDYGLCGPVRLAPADFHDFSHMVGDTPIRVGEQIGRDLVDRYRTPGP